MALQCFVINILFNKTVLHYCIYRQLNRTLVRETIHWKQMFGQMDRMTKRPKYHKRPKLKFQLDIWLPQCFSLLIIYILDLVISCNTIILIAVKMEISESIWNYAYETSILIINQSNLVPTNILEPFFILFANCSF